MDIRRDIKFLNSRKLIQVCFGRYQLQLRFTENIIIEVAHEIRYYEEGKDFKVWNSEVINSNFNINELLEQIVVESSVDSNDNLNILFNKASLVVYSQKDGFESYIVYNKLDFEVIY